MIKKSKDTYQKLPKPIDPCINSLSSNSPKRSTICITDENGFIEVHQNNSDVIGQSYSPEPYCPVFFISIGIIDIFLLLFVYIIQGGTIPTTATWIKMGCKYVPCMKPLYSKIEQEIYATSLKPQCESFFVPYQFLRFFIPIFLHSGITHLLSNLIYQLLAGCLLEGKYGIKTLGICYILFGFSGNIMSALFNPKNISFGASGAVYGLLLFCMIDNILRIFTIKNMHDKIIQSLLTFVVIPYFIVTIFIDVDVSGRTDHAAHIGGAVMGILVSLILCDMPKFITDRILNAEKRIPLIALTIIIVYILLMLIAFYFFLPAKLN